MSAGFEIDATAFEQELRSGADVVVVDTRPAADYAQWHLPDARQPVVNVSERELAEQPDRARALLEGHDALRVICASGSASLRAVARLTEQGVEALSVRGGMIGWSRVLQRGDVPVDGPYTIVQLRREARGCLSYVIAAGGEALVVDPAPDVRAYLEVVAQLGARVVRVFDTHIHADHLSGGRELAERTGAPLSLSVGAIDRGLRFADKVLPVRDGDVISLGGNPVTVVALPGHTTDMTGLLVGDVALVGGDSVFADSVARPDLEAGDEGADDAARQLHRTLAARVAPLRDDVVLLPCHYASGRLDGALVARLGDVRRAVPELGLGETAFVETVLSHMPPKPANFLTIIGVNLGEEELEADAAARLEVGANNCAAKAEWADVPA